MWPFGKKAKKYAGISVHDYPASKYWAYWEIKVAAEAPFAYTVRIMARSDSRTLRAFSGICDTENAARKESQQWVKQAMKEYAGREPAWTGVAEEAN